MKRHYFLFLLFIHLISSLTLYSHGFGARTSIYISCGLSCDIQTIYHNHKRNWTKPLVLSKCRYANKNHLQKVVGHIKGTTNCYFRLGFDPWFNDDILCTPSQEFFVPAQQKWVPAFQLKVGDELFNKHYQLIPITHMQLVTQPLKIYAIEVEDTHNYFVGRHAILTHNLPIPWAFSISLSTSWGAGTTGGGLLGLLGLGPLTIGGGLVLGGLVGLSVYALSKHGLPKLQFDFDIPKLQGMAACDVGPFPLADSSLYYKIDQEQKLYDARNNNSGGSYSGGSNGGNGGDDPRDPRNRGAQANNKPPRNSNNKNNQPERKLNQRPLTNKEAREQAKKWGYQETKEGKFDSHGKPKFKKGNSIISPDRNCHNGGVWKEFDLKDNRIGTLDINMKRIKG